MNQSLPSPVRLLRITFSQVSGRILIDRTLHGEHGRCEVLSPFTALLPRMTLKRWPYSQKKFVDDQDVTWWLATLCAHHVPCWIPSSKAGSQTLGLADLNDPNLWTILEQEAGERIPVSFFG